jgi:hypothetical protein
MIKRKFDFILFDMMGTIIKDTYKDDSLIENNLLKAFSFNGFDITPNEVNQFRGKSKKEIEI